jgi:membrane-bound lytic murein transglycosylase D
MEGDTLRKKPFQLLLSQFLVIVAAGCAAFSPQKKTTSLGTDASEIALEAEIPAVDDTLTAFTHMPNSETLDQLITCLDEASTARIDGNYGLAETKIEEALILASEVDITSIGDKELLSRFSDVVISIAQEDGRILRESSIIAEEDPTAWLEDVDIEQFRSGQWSDEELEKIVNKIALKCDVPIEFNQKVRNAIYFFQNSRRKEMEAWQSRSGKYLPMMQKIFEEEGLPRDMVYLSMIESGFKPTAYSSARAVGLWQFIYSTGKIYGLDRNQWIDERRDPLKATYAAARHLNDLYKTTDDWNNVMAGYNAGIGRVNRQLEKDENIEYWDMQLPRETQSYVPFFMAAVVISKAPEVFGFDHIEKESPLDFDVVEVNPYTNLSTAAKCCDTDLAILRDLNPELLKDRVPPGTEKYQLRIPKNTCEKFLAAYEQIPAETYQPPKVEYVLVGRGDTFSIIANRHRVSVNSLKTANPQIKNINSLSVGQRINMPGGATVATSTQTTGSSTRKTTSSSTSAASSTTSTVIYTVKSNDTLGSIARDFGTTFKYIQQLNKMGSSTKIAVGQKLKVPVNKIATATSAKNQEVAAAKVYVVKKNDTIDNIAQQFGVDYKRVMEHNGISDPRKIKPGDRLEIPR